MKTAEEYFKEWKIKKKYNPISNRFSHVALIEFGEDYSNQQNADLKAEIQKDAVLRIAILKENEKLKERVKELESGLSLTVSYIKSSVRFPTDNLIVQIKELEQLLTNKE